MSEQPGAQVRGLAPPCCSAVPVPAVALWELRTAGTGTSVPIPMNFSDFHGVVYFTLRPRRSGGKRLLI